MKLRPVLQGDEITLPSVEKDGSRGGFARKFAPTAGFFWEAGDTCGFIKGDDVGAALVDLKLLQRSGRKKPPRFKGRGVLCHQHAERKGRGL